MRLNVAALMLGLGLFTVGCGGGRDAGVDPRTPSSERGSAFEASGSAGYPAAPASQSKKAAEAAPSAGGEADSVTSAPPRTADAHAESPASPNRSARPTERPGLGTEWGETRRSRIREVGFERDSSDPTGVVALHYNDREGARALASFRDTRPIPTAGVTALGGAVRVTIEGEGGSPLQAMTTGDRTVVVGSAGQRYTIVLTNRTGRRFEAVASVDGLDVISGRSASFDQRGYVLLPFATLRIEGFRQSERAVAAFRFSRVAESYAAQTGSARNVGVIGVAFFRERGDNGISQEELELRDSATPFPSEPSRFARPPR